MNIFKKALLASTLALGLSGCNFDNNPPTEYLKVQITGTTNQLAVVTYKSHDLVGMYQDPIEGFTELASTETYSATVDVYNTSMDTGDSYSYTVDIERQEDYAIINGERYEVTYTDTHGSIISYTHKFN